MRPRVSWIVPADAEILRFFDGHDIDEFAAPPKAVYLNLGMSDSHVQRRIKTLSSAGLLKKLDDSSYYQITDLGRRYLKGDVEKEEMEDINPDKED